METEWEVRGRGSAANKEVTGWRGAHCQLSPPPWSSETSWGKHAFSGRNNRVRVRVGGESHCQNPLTLNPCMLNLSQLPTRGPSFTGETKPLSQSVPGASEEGRESQTTGNPHHLAGTFQAPQLMVPHNTASLQLREHDTLAQDSRTARSSVFPWRYRVPALGSQATSHSKTFSGFPDPGSHHVNLPSATS